jgi:hypothetical protein
MTDEDFPALEHFSQLPDAGDTVFLIGQELVRFTAHEEYGCTAGWTVNTSQPGYRSYLRAGRDTVWTEVGPEPMRTYEFEFRQGADGVGPVFMSGSPTDVSIEELRAFYFGDHSEDR